MPPKMSLTETAVKNSKPREKPYKLSDAKGLYVQVNPNGSKQRRGGYHTSPRFSIADCSLVEASPMRTILFVSAFLMSGSFALAQSAPRIDLDRPGVLEDLKQQHPQRYQAVSALLRASEHPACQGSEIQLLKTRFNVRDVECGMMLLTSYPAKRHVSFELEGTNYAATVVLKDAETLQPISPAIDSRGSH
jgi:hypothetical protein